MSGMARSASDTRIRAQDRRRNSDGTAPVYVTGAQKLEYLKYQLSRSQEPLLPFLDTDLRKSLAVPKRQMKRSAAQERADQDEERRRQAEERAKQLDKKGDNGNGADTKGAKKREQVNIYAPIEISEEAQEENRLIATYGVDTLQLGKMRKYFTELDADGSGLLDKDEFKVLVCRAFHAKNIDDIPKERVEEFWNRIDADGSGEVSFEEFVAWYSTTLGDGGQSPTDSFYNSFLPNTVKK